MDVNAETARKLREMGAAELLAALSAQDEAVCAGMAFAERVQMAVDEAHSDFITQKVRNLTRRAGLRYPEADVRSVDFFEGRGLDRVAVAELATCGFVGRGENVVLQGLTGTGKTYLAMAMAVAALKRKEVGRIVLTRPVVEAGESLGFLPGTLQEKLDPYVRPLYDALFDMTDMERGNALIEQGVIEIAPLAFMRGRTLNDAFVILDEAQNTTPEQMKMFLTRLGFGSKFVVTGDASQRDLRGSSGLDSARRVLADVEDISFVELDRNDIVRHTLVARIVDAYDRSGEA